MAKKPIDQERAIKWAARAVEWQRLSAESLDEHVADMCTRHARESMSMAEYWGGL